MIESIFLVLSLSLERIAPFRRQKFFRTFFWQDAFYLATNSLLPRYVYSGIWLVFTSVLAYLLGEGWVHYRMQGIDLVSRHPFWLQILEGMLARDFLLYWIHRAFHHRWLWPFHAIHHQAKELDWLVGDRRHLFNTFGMFPSQLPLLLLGFRPDVVGYLQAFFFSTGWIYHTNVRWDFGRWLRPIVVSPLLHRWHHTEVEGRVTNYASVFSFWDRIFGTYYWSDERKPEILGAGEEIPDNFLGQFLYPFRALRGRRVPVPVKVDPSA